MNTVHTLTASPSGTSADHDPASLLSFHNQTHRPATRLPNPSLLTAPPFPAQ